MRVGPPPVPRLELQVVTTLMRNGQDRRFAKPEKCLVSYNPCLNWDSIWRAVNFTYLQHFPHEQHRVPVVRAGARKISQLKRERPWPLVSYP
jgi:hypothetical protein